MRSDSNFPNIPQSLFSPFCSQPWSRGSLFSLLESYSLHIQATLAKDTHTEFPYNTLFSGPCLENSSPFRSLELFDLHLFSYGRLLNLGPHPLEEWQESTSKKKARAIVGLTLCVFLISKIIVLCCLIVNA